jgi:hypothetical protein
MEYGFTMFSIVGVYTKAAQYKALPAESSFRLEKVGGKYFRHGKTHHKLIKERTVSTGFERFLC